MGAASCGCRLERGSLREPWGSNGDKEEQSWTEEGAGVLAALKDPKFLEVLLGLSPKGIPPHTHTHQLPRVWIQGQTGEGRVAWKPTAWPSPRLN